MSSLLFPVFKLSRENTQLVKYVWHYFWKHRSRRSEVFCKEGVLRNFTKLTGKHLCQSLLFWDKDSLNVEAQAFSCEFCEISKNTFLHRTPLVATSENTKGILQKQPSKGSLKKVVMRHFVEFTRKHFPESPFLIKANAVDLQLL